MKIPIKTPEEYLKQRNLRFWIKEECFRGMREYADIYHESFTQPDSNESESYHAQFKGEFSELLKKIEIHIETTEECMENFNIPDYVGALLKQGNQLFLEIINKIKRV